MSDANRTQGKQFHDIQREIMDGDYGDSSRAKIHESWFDETTADYWRHARTLELLNPLTVEHRDGEWLTVGDGRYGLDSVRLRKVLGLTSVLPTDISGVALKAGADRGLFDRYSVENIEELSFADDSFDVVVCKESYHHLPRAIVGLYEMIRVARHVVALIEPQMMRRVEVRPGKKLPLFQRLKRALRGDAEKAPKIKEVKSKPGYEESGNYMYRISYRETEQVVRGLDLPGFAWKGFADKHLPGVEFAKAVDGDPLFEELKAAIEEIESKCRGAAEDAYPLAVGVIFKTLPSPETLEQFRALGFDVRTDTRNPVLARRESQRTDGADSSSR